MNRLYKIFGSLFASLLIVYAAMCLIQRQIVIPWNVSAGYLIKFGALTIGVAVILYALICLICNGFKERLRRYFKLSFWPVFFALFTILLYIPVSLYLSNIKEFLVPAWSVLAIFFVILLVGLIGCSLLISAINDRVAGIITAVIMAVGLGVYVQSNFMNRNMPLLDGSSFDWNAHTIDAIVSIVVWVGIAVTTFLLLKKLSDRAFKIFRYLSIALILMQLVSLITLFISNAPVVKNYGVVTQDGEFDLGHENIIMFVVDSLDSGTLEAYFDEYQEDEEIYSDFTFFSRSVGGGAPTRFGMPVILTGTEYDTYEDEDEYYDNAWADATLWTDMKSEDYDVRMYASVIDALYRMPNEYAENIIDADNAYRVLSKSGFLKTYSKFMGLYELPYPIKRLCMVTTEELTENVGVSEEYSQYWVDAASFRDDMNSCGDFLINYDKAFRYYHFHGIHAPCRQDEDLNYFHDATVNMTLRGNLKVINQYIDRLKTLGVYDRSTIIICGDHGSNIEGGIMDNPALLIKCPGEEHDSILINEAPITMRNLYSTIARVAFDEKSMNDSLGDVGASDASGSGFGDDAETRYRLKYGPSVYDITEESNQLRLHTITDELVDSYDTDRRIIRVIPKDADSLAIDAPIWNPYEINVVNWSSDDEYLSFDGMVLSNEYTTCINLDDSHLKKDVNVKLGIEDIWGDEQTIIISANGHRIGKFVCMKDSLEDIQFTIPKEYLGDGRVYIRLVMPNAVTPHMLDENSSYTRVVSVKLR